jgi:hypothetical protein
MVMKTKTLIVTLLALITATLLGALPCMAQAEKLNEEEAFNIATEAYIYGYPLVTMEGKFCHRESSFEI